MFRNVHKEIELLLLIFGVTAAVPVTRSPTAELDTDIVFDSRGSTDIEVVRQKYTWTINNFNLADYVNGQRVNSPTFVTHNECEWYLFLYPKGYDQQSADYVSLFLDSVSCQTIAKVQFNILNAKQETINNKSFYYSFPKGGNIGFEKFVSQDYVLNRKNGVLVDNTLTIICEVNVTLTNTDVVGKLKPPPQDNDLGKDLEFLLDNEYFSDVKLSVGGKDLAALKGVLAARSSVFKSMFYEVANVSRVDIDDVDADVVMEMLRYVYTGEVSHLDNLASSLLVLAEKYELIGLKTMCENTMAAKLSVENAAEFYILGDTYFAVDLKRQAKIFIVANASSVINTTGFKSLIQTHPLLVEEVFSAMAALNGKTT